MATEFERLAQGKPTELRVTDEVKEAIEQRDERTICGGAFTVTWTTGPKRGLPVTTYCAEPLCINEGVCTGQRFVPHMQQYTTVDKDADNWAPRELDAPEIIAAVRAVGEKARSKGARPLEWSDRQIARFVGMVWKKTMAALRGDGTQWGR
jgi:hypothetical protein